MEAQVPEFKITLPPHEKFILPSRGLLYGDRLPGGVIHIRPMTIKEEKILATERLVKSGEALDLIFKSCIQEDFNIPDLLSADKSAVLFWLRAASYGPEYNVKISCPNQSCKATHQLSLNLETDFDISYADETLVEPLNVYLPKSQVNVKFILPRAKHEDIIARYRKQAQGMNAKNKSVGVDNTLTERLKLFIQEVDGVEKQFIGHWLETLIAYDSSVLKDAINKDYLGIDTTINYDCDKCGTEIETEMPITKDFFRVNT